MGDSPPMVRSSRSHVQLALLRVVTDSEATDRARINTLQFIARQGIISDSILSGIASSFGMSKSMVQSWLCVLYELQFYNEDISIMKRDMLQEYHTNALLPVRDMHTEAAANELLSLSNSRNLK